MTQNKNLAHLSSQIKASGPMRFDAFMHWALYDPSYGYYHQPPGMSGADFITAPEMGSLFSDALIHFISQLGPSCRNLVELGPGTGLLMSKLKDHFKDRFESFCLVEISESLKKVQLEKEGSLKHIGLSDIPQHSLIIANEWLDALPSRRIKRVGDQCLEAYIGIDEGELAWQWQPVNIELTHWPMVDGIYDVRDYANVFKSMAQALKGSICVWFDYGYHAKELMHLPHLGDSLRGFYQNTVESNVLNHIGHMDLTADVNFSVLAHQAADEGWQINHYFKQSHWIIDYLMKHPNRENNTWEVRQLTDPSEMGERVRCLVFSDPSLDVQKISYDECARL